MTDRKYQVFISSTYSDLIEERKRIMDILLMADCIPAGMEAFVATDSEQFEVIKKVIDLCDYYILIVGHRYGSIDLNTGISYTEMEYDYAIEKNIPVLAFALDENVQTSEEKKEQDAEKIYKLQEFRKKVLSNRLCSIWKSTDELVGQVAVSIMTAKNQIDRPGWQRGRDFDEASLRRTIMNLQDENDSLREELKLAKDTIQIFNDSQDLDFEDYVVKIRYYFFNMNVKTSKSVEKKLPEIFLVIATAMLNISLTESAIEEVIKKYVYNGEHSIYLDDFQEIKKILIQLQALNLVYSSWSKEKNRLYWGLTSKGTFYRDRALVKRKNNDEIS